MKPRVRGRVKPEIITKVYPPIHYRITEAIKDERVGQHQPGVLLQACLVVYEAKYQCRNVKDCEIHRRKYRRQNEMLVRVIVIGEPRPVDQPCERVAKINDIAAVIAK